MDKYAVGDIVTLKKQKKKHQKIEKHQEIEKNKEIEKTLANP